eukprot:scaffold3987_cov249-Prasinococcus_capsulatus_cf.AAC.3
MAHHEPLPQHPYADAAAAAAATAASAAAAEVDGHDQARRGRPLRLARVRGRGQRRSHGLLPRRVRAALARSRGGAGGRRPREEREVHGILLLVVNAAELRDEPRARVAGLAPHVLLRGCAALALHLGQGVVRVELHLRPHATARARNRRRPPHRAAQQSLARWPTSRREASRTPTNLVLVGHPAQRQRHEERPQLLGAHGRHDHVPAEDAVHHRAPAVPSTHASQRTVGRRHSRAARAERGWVEGAPYPSPRLSTSARGGESDSGKRTAACPGASSWRSRASCTCIAHQPPPRRVRVVASISNRSGGNRSRSRRSINEDDDANGRTDDGGAHLRWDLAVAPVAGRSDAGVAAHVDEELAVAAQQLLVGGGLRVAAGRAQHARLGDKERLRRDLLSRLRSGHPPGASAAAGL